MHSLVSVNFMWEEEHALRNDVFWRIWRFDIFSVEMQILQRAETLKGYLIGENGKSLVKLSFFKVNKNYNDRFLGHSVWYIYCTKNR